MAEGSQTPSRLANGIYIGEYLMNLFEVTDGTQKSEICSKILNALPDWFGVPEAVVNYIKNTSKMPFYACSDGENTVGFVAIKDHNAYTSEVYVMGVLQHMHRQGIGKKLIEKCIEHCKNANKKYLTVKTLADSHPDEGYKKTRLFYQSFGFAPLEVFTEIWDEANPCLFLVLNI